MSSNHSEFLQISNVIYLEKSIFTNKREGNRKKNKKCVTVEPLLRTTSLQRPLFLADSPYIADIDSDFFFKESSQAYLFENVETSKMKKWQF